MNIWLWKRILREIKKKKRYSPYQLFFIFGTLLDAKLEAELEELRQKNAEERNHQLKVGFLFWWRKERLFFLFFWFFSVLVHRASGSFCFFQRMIILEDEKKYVLFFSGLIGLPPCSAPCERKYNCTAGNFRQEFNIVAFVKGIFWLN